MKSGRRKDPEFFAGLLRFAKTKVQEALEKFDERYEFDPQNIAGTEMEIALDESFAPLEPIGKGGGTRRDTGNALRTAQAWTLFCWMRPITR